jgi:Hint domain
VNLGGGTYTVTMAAYLPTDSAFTTPVTPTSTVLTLTKAMGTPPPCFAAGTRISTDRGEVPVECLMVGDIVRSRHAGPVPVVWLGRRRVDRRRHTAPQDVSAAAGWSAACRK